MNINKDKLNEEIKECLQKKADLKKEILTEYFGRQYNEQHDLRRKINNLEVRIETLESIYNCLD